MTQILSLLPVYQFVIITFIIIAIIRILKWKEIFTDSYQPVFDKLVTEIAVPAVIFSIFATHSFTFETLIPTCILFVVLITSLLVSYCIFSLFRLPPATLGTLVMVSAFGSTATMASPLIASFFSSQPAVIEQGNLIGTLGVALPFFTIGPIIASYFGGKAQGREMSVAHTLRDFLVTPIFVAFILGVGFAAITGFFKITGSSIITDIFTQFFTVVSLSLELLIWISIGLSLHKISPKTFFPFLLLVFGIKMLFEPLLAESMLRYFNFSASNHLILLLETAVPSGAIAAVLASRYGCDSSLAGWMVIGTYLCSLVTIPLLLTSFL